MDNFKHKKNAPSNEEFIQMMAELVTGKKTDTYDYSVDVADLTNQIRLLLQDEFNGEARVEIDNAISLYFTNGERFIIKVEKCDVPVLSLDL